MKKLLIVILSLNFSCGLLANDEEKELEELLKLTQNDSELEEALFRTLERELKKLGSIVSYKDINKDYGRSWDDVKKDLDVFLNDMPYFLKRRNYSTSDAPDNEIKKVVRFNLSE